MKQLHAALFSRAMKEISEGSMKEAQISVELMEKVGTGEADMAAQVLAALLGDNGIPDEE